MLEKSFPAGVTVQGFADDITIVSRRKTRKELETRANETLKIIEEWAVQNKLAFNIAKCKFLVVEVDYQKRPPLIKMYNKSIQNVKELKILGITFDTKLSFLTHLKIIQAKTNKLTSLARFSGHNWGMSPHHIRTLYIRAIERIIIYGCQTWYSKQSHIIRKLQAIPRIPLIKICKAFQTILNLMLQVVTWIPPIYLAIEREIEMYKISKGITNFTCKEYNFTTESIVDKIDKWETHPADTARFS